MVTKKKAIKSPLAAKFEQAWAIIGGPALDTEVRFCPDRLWRFDYAHRESKVAIEINGGTRRGGRHNRHIESIINAKGERMRKGYLLDLQKMNHAQVLGWDVFQLAGDLIDDLDELGFIKLRINWRMANKSCQKP